MLYDEDDDPVDLDEIIRTAFDTATPAEVLSRVADQIKLRVPASQRSRLLAAFTVEAYGGHPVVPHMAGYENPLDIAKQTI